MPKSEIASSTMGQQLRVYLVLRSVSADELAAACKVGRPAVDNWLNDRNPPRLAQFGGVAAALKLSDEELGGLVRAAATVGRS